MGFAPQFTCAHPMLTVAEAVGGALEIAGVPKARRAERLAEILETVGLGEHADKLVGSLSGGQLRRIGLGVELCGRPPAMCCDEVTSGLDRSRKIRYSTSCANCAARGARLSSA